MSLVLPPSELRRLFFQEVPELVLVDTAKIVIGSYVEAFQYSRDNYPGPEAHDLYPIVRRAMLERNLRARLSRYPEVTVEVKPNAIGNCFHTEIRVGRVIMTVSAVETQEEPVRSAVFRTGLARTSQLNLFAVPEPPPPDAALYAILLHGPLGFTLPCPGFLNVGFPAGDCDAYVDRFSLLDYFPVLQAEIDKLPKLPERKKPRIRRDQDEKVE